MDKQGEEKKIEIRVLLRVTATKRINKLVKIKITKLVEKENKDKIQLHSNLFVIYQI
jgi:hypothetical protein